VAVHKFTNAGIYLDGYDVQTDHNQIAIAHNAEALDKTTFGATTRQHLGGLKSVELSGNALTQYDSSGVAIEDLIKTWEAVQGLVFTVTPNGATAGDVAYIGKGLITGHKPVGGAVGELHQFGWQAGGQKSPLTRAAVVAAKASRTTSSNASAGQIGALAANQRLYAALHVFSKSGSSPTLDVIVASDDNSGFTSATTRGTFAQKTNVGAELLAINGAVTDDYWRVAWTIGGSSTPTFSFAVSIGIVTLG
jgi:hypothetical protein